MSEYRIGDQSWMKAAIDFSIEAFMWLAALGVCCLLACFILVWAGEEHLSNAVADVLFPALFVVWFPTVLVGSRLTHGARRSDFWKVALAGCPRWMRTTLYVGMGLGAANFLYFVVFGGNRKDLPMIYFGGGHMFAFYGIAFCVLYSAHAKPDLMELRKCPNGHEISPTDSFCPDCGAATTSVLPPPL